MSIRSIFSNLRQSIRRRTHPGHRSGFTLIELLVVLAIISMMSGVVLVSNSVFSSRLVVDNLAHSIALVIREAQTYALSVKEASAGVFPGYGIYFNTFTPTEFQLYADSNGNRRYDAGERIERKILNNGMTISSITCVPACGGADLDIVFTRPNPDAYMTSGGIVRAQGVVTLRSPKGFVRTISVWTTGQISVQ